MRARSRRLLLTALVTGTGLLPVLADGASYIVRPDETLTGNRTEVGIERVLAGTLEGNLKFGGLNLSIPGAVRGDLEFGGINLVLTGQVTGDARISGISADIRGTVGRDLTATVAEFSLHPGARVARNAEVKSGQVTILGEIDGDLQATGGTITLGGVVKGNASLEAEEIVLREGARIAGNLSYTARTPLDLEGKQIVGGEIQYGAREAEALRRKIDARLRALDVPRPPMPPDFPSPYEYGDHEEDHGGGPGFGFFVLSLLFGLLAVWIFQRHVPTTVEAVRQEPALTLGIGFMGLIVIPVVTALAALLIITLPLVVVVLLLYGAALFLSQVPVGVWLGGMILGRTRWAGASLYATLAVGLVVPHLLALVPVVKIVVIVATVLLGFGAILVAGHAWWRSRKAPVSPPTPAPAVS